MGGHGIIRATPVLIESGLSLPIAPEIRNDMALLEISIRMKIDFPAKVLP